MQCQAIVCIKIFSRLITHSHIKQISIVTNFNKLYAVIKHNNIVKLYMKREIFLHYFLNN